MSTFAAWETGVITVPSSTGPMSITGLTTTPQALFFFGTNFLTEDAVVNSTGSGLFRGMCGPLYNSLGTLVQNACAASPSGDQHEIASGVSILAQTVAGSATRLYAASVTAIVTRGFTLNWSTAAAGGYKVVWLAISGVDNIGAYVGAFTSTLGLGWKAGACLMHGGWAGPDITGSDRTQDFFGGGAYRGNSQLNWQAASATIFTFPTSFAGQYISELNNFSPHILTASGGSFIGPFLSGSNILLYPNYAGSLTDFVYTGDGSNGGMAVIWDDEDNATGRVTPGTNSGDTTVVSGLPFHPALVLGYSISNEPQGQGTGARGALQLSLATDTGFQWCAVVDVGAPSYVTGGGAFQSFQRGFADVVDTSVVHAGKIRLTPDGFIMTTFQDSIAPANWVYHVFGHPKGAWIPQYYRTIPTRGKVGA